MRTTCRTVSIGRVQRSLQMHATLDGSGKLQSWQHGVAAQSGDSVGAGAEPAYAIPSVHVTGADVTRGVPDNLARR